MRKLLFSVLFVAACSPLAPAQGTNGERDKFNFFAGYSHNRVDTGFNDNDPQLDDIIDEREGFNGFNASITGNVSRYLGLKFDYSFHRRSIEGAVPGINFRVDSDIHNFLGGVQIKDNRKDSGKALRPFAHLLVGAANARVDVEQECQPGFVCLSNFSRSDTGLAAAVGGGLDIRLNDRLDVRAIQLDWNPNRFNIDGTPGANDTQTAHNFRIGVGIVIK
jgi:Outer membrane protein beta-barrel domain